MVVMISGLLEVMIKESMDVNVCSRSKDRWTSVVARDQRIDGRQWLLLTNTCCDVAFGLRLSGLHNDAAKITLALLDGKSKAQVVRQRAHCSAL